MLMKKEDDLKDDLKDDLIASDLQLICIKRQLLPNMKAYSASLTV